MIKYKNNINVGTGSVGYEADATSATPQDSVNEGRIVKSEGRTVKWNQLVQNGNFQDSTKWTAEEGRSVSINNGIATISISDRYASNNGILSTGYIKAISGHKYYTSVYAKINTVGGTKMELSITLVNTSSGLNYKALTNTWNRTSAIIAPVNSSNMSKANIRIIDTASGGSADVKDCFIIDLTEIFGAGNEPATVEAFEEWMSENMVEQDYYAYDAGSLVPVTVKGVKRNVEGTTVTNPMPVTTLKDENDVVMFPDGLKSAGSVKDEIDWEHGVAVKRVGVVDMGDLTWAAESTANVYSFGRTAYGIARYSTVVCAKYPYVGLMGASQMDDKTMGGGASGLYVMIKDSSYSTAADFKTAMQGVLLYYELATPITYHFATHSELKKRVVKIGESVEVDGIEGETVVWNQLVQNGDFSNGTADWAGYHVSIAATNNILTATITTTSTNYLGKNNFSFKIGHRYLFVCDINPSSNTYVRFQHVGFGTDFPNAGTQIIGNTWNHYSCIGTITATPNNYLYLYLNITSSLAENATVAVKNLMVHDLTDIFGAGNEPSTIAEFESWLSAHGGIKDYYPYCAGELKDKEEGNVRGVTQNPYKSITRSVDLTTLKGKVDGAGEDVVIFPDGMKQAGSVKDEIFFEGGVVKAVKRVGTVDLGELEWVYNNASAGHERFNVALSDSKMPLSASTAGNIITPKYDNKPFNDVYGHTADKIIALASTNNILAVYDSAYTSASDFKTAMQGVMLNYELDSPVTYVVNMQGLEMAEVKKVMVGTQKVWEKP